MRGESSFWPMTAHQARHASDLRPRLNFGLIPDGLRAAAAGRLVELIRAAGNHLGRGFLATRFLLPVLADTGHLDVAYELLFQDTEPSLLVIVDRGATTIWDEWVESTPTALLTRRLTTTARARSSASSISTSPVSSSSSSLAINVFALRRDPAAALPVPCAP
jgi:hypothetical protein